MPHYRLYFLDGARHIRHALDLECESDEAASGMADEHRDGRAMELWRGDKLLQIYEAEGR